MATLDMVRTRSRCPSFAPAGVPADLETICLKCLRKEPEKRYASADALANDPPPAAARPIRAGPFPRWKRAPPCATPSGSGRVGRLRACVARGSPGPGYLVVFGDQPRPRRSNAAKLESQRMSAGLALDRGLQLCREGKVSEGMLWMAESLAVNPEEDRGFADGCAESHRLAGDHDRSTILDRPRTMGDVAWPTARTVRPVSPPRAALCAAGMP